MEEAGLTVSITSVWTLYLFSCSCGKVEDEDWEDRECVSD
jgi:hypothetical protein